MRRWIIAAVVAGLTTVAAADPSAKDRAAAAFADGQQHYSAGDYLVAADRFEAAYALDADPAYLFNIAQAYRFGNACAKAAGAYRKFLGAVENPPNAAKVQQYLQQADDCAKQQAAAEHPSPPPPDPITPHPPPRHERPEASPGRGARLAGLGIAGFGVVVTGVAVYFTQRTYHYASQREAVCPDGCTWDATKQMRADAITSDGNRAQTRARITWIVGGATLVGGTVLYLLGRSAEHERAQIAVVPTAEGAMAFGSFRF